MSYLWHSYTGYDRQRIFMEEHVGNKVRTKRYVGNCEYVAYGLKDNLGSWTTITDENGEVQQRLNYDAWGNLRNPSTWANYTVNDTYEKPLFDRGYTGHEHLSSFGLINMNGRMYDPVMSAFLSPDRFVQNPMSAQGFNRYAYCMNNPLRYTDPSGWRCIGGITGYTPNSADYGRDPYAYADSRGWEPRDLGYRQLPANDPAVTWMEENKLCGGNGANGGETTEPSSKSNEEDPPKGVKVHSGKKLLFKAYWHYQFGRGDDFWVDASTLDLDYISQKDLIYYENGTASINLFDYSKTDQAALALGKIDLIPLGNNQYEIRFDKYDFNIEWDQSWSTRNIGTVVSGFLNGPVIDNTPIPTHWMGGKPCYAQPSVYFGGPFEIHFSKSVYIKP